MSLEDFDLWYNVDPETASPVIRKHVYLDETLPKLPTIRWNTGTMWSGRSIETLNHKQEFDAWCDEHLPYHWQGLYMEAKFPGDTVINENEDHLWVRVKRPCNLFERFLIWFKVQTRKRREITFGVGSLGPEDIVFLEDDIAHGVGGG